MDALFAGFLFGAAGRGGAAEPFEFAAQLVLAFDFGDGEGFVPDGAEFEVLGVVAGIADEFAAVEFDDGVGDAVEEVAVVRDHEQGRGEGEEGLFQPGDGVGVNVVGGFVEDQ